MDTSKKPLLSFPPSQAEPGTEKGKPAPWWVVKVGGSLFGRPGLGPRLQAWLAGQPTRRILLIPGGGSIVEAVRMFDQRQQLGDEASHWLAIGGMSLMAQMVAALVPGGLVVSDFRAATEAWSRQGFPILNVMDFLRRDETDEQRLPHAWAVTSDSIAARIAAVHGAAKLVLLKSCPVPTGRSLEELAGRGVVDAWFPCVARGVAEVEVTTLE